MPNFLLVPVFVSVLFGFVPPAHAETVGFPVEIYDIMDDQRLVVFLREEDIAASPQWRPSRGGPPLTIGGALEQIRRWTAQDARLEGAEIHEIELKPLHHHGQEHRWYYLLQLRTVEKGKPRISYAAVLLTGKVVPAIAEPAAIK